MQEAHMNWSNIDKILLVGGMTRMPMIREMIQEVSGVPLADHVSPDEAVAVGAAIQGMLSILSEEDKTGEKSVPKETRQQFSTREGGLIQVTNITSHTLGVVLWNEDTLEEYVFPMIKKMTAMSGGVQKQFRHGAGEHGEGRGPRRRGRKHPAERMHAAGDLRGRFAALPAKGRRR